MKAEVTRRLLDINREFYQSFGEDFSATRGRIQPGVRSILERLAGSERILDLGCGNGELARQLAKQGHHGTYTGLDFSPPLLEDAGKQPGLFPVDFRQADLSGPDWDKDLPAGEYERVFAFAALHHIPSEELRLQILCKAARLLDKQGQFIHSEWQFMNSARLRERIQPWQAAGINEEELDPGDSLLDWRQGGHGLRYVHHFNEVELSQLAEATGFRILETFLSDGQGGNLGLYQIWELI
jgi:tRNA (uracil-5-)-methyltransferase TRM9